MYGVHGRRVLGMRERMMCSVCIDRCVCVSSFVVVSCSSEKVPGGGIAAIHSAAPISVGSMLSHFSLV